jgi:hypothetical protein
MKSSILGRCAISLCVTATMLAGCGGSQQPVGVPATNAVAPAQVPASRPTDAEVERWRSMMLRLPNPGHGCRKAIYPETRWTELRCRRGLGVPHMPANANPVGVGPLVGGNAFFAMPTGGHITAAKGWFPTVKNVTTEQSVGGTNSGNDGPNYYSLQINTNGFTAPGMCPNAKCIGWEQFYFDNEGNTSGSDGALQIEYWLINFAPCASSTCTDTCPHDWQGVHQGSSKNPESCTSWSDETDVQSYEIDNGLKFFRVSGASASRPGGSGSDYVTLDVEGGPSPELYQQDGNNVFPNLSGVWDTAEFNVYGECCHEKAVFAGKPTIAARLAVTTVNGTEKAPGCPRNLGGIVTGESNNLALTTTSSKWPIKDWPAVVFTENGTGSKHANCVPVKGS